MALVWPRLGLGLRIGLGVATVGFVATVSARPPQLTVRLLKEPAVCRELRLSPRVKEKLQNLFSEGRKVPLPRHDPKTGEISEEEAQRFSESHASQNRLALALLTEAQIERLGEISLQLEGAPALQSPTVADAVGLNEAQVRKLKLVGQSELEHYFEDLPAQTRARVEVLQARSLRIRAIVDSAAKKILTPKQWAKWLDLQGKPFAPEKRG